MIHENFFDENSGTLKGLNCHEICLYFLMNSRGTKKLYSNSYTFGVKEEMCWIPVRDMGKYKVFPKFFEDYFCREHYGIEHIVSDERIYTPAKGTWTK